MSDDLPELNLLDALCVMQMGWRTEFEHDLYKKASDIVWIHARKVRLSTELETLTKKEQENGTKS